MGQLALRMQLRDEASFDNYWVSPANQIMFRALQAFCQPDNAGLADPGQVLYLWGRSGVGKTHLALAVAARCSHSRYIPLEESANLHSGMLETTGDAIADRALWWIWDNVEAVVGQSGWEEALFHAYNTWMAQSQVRLLITSAYPPAQLPDLLPDLRSRLAHACVFHVMELDDTGKLQALLWRAHKRGISLPVPVAQYVLNHGPRDMGQLMEILTQLDMASLQQQRNWTIPFVKAVLDRSGIPGRGG